MNTSQELRFAFGKNWESYSQTIDDDKIKESARRMASLCGKLSLTDKTFLDIGCGSGLHSVSALELGAASVTAIDLDPDSVKTSQQVLNQHAAGKPFQVTQKSVFDLKPETDGTYDVVYSWGVLHHTGNLAQALRCASSMVKPGGHFVVALYGKTKFCGVWKRIKRWYVGASEEQKQRAENWYIRLFGWYLLLRGKRLSTHIASYAAKRGMDFKHDVRDWIGGYPYESITPNELVNLLRPLGFTPLIIKARRRSGLFGSGCDEYVFIKEE